MSWEPNKPLVPTRKGEAPLLGIAEDGPVAKPERDSPTPPKAPSTLSTESGPPDSSADSSPVHQACALLVAVTTFFLVWVVVGLLLVLLDQFRGLGNDWLQSVFRDVFAPWVGGYAGVTAGLRWLNRSTAKFVFLAFSVVVLLLAGAYLGFVGAVRLQAEISATSFIWGSVTLLAGIFGAYKAARDDGFTL